jgi:thiamine biosynthesis lipoprotein
MKPDRRKFLFGVLGSGAALAAGTAGWRASTGRALYTRKGFALGAPVSLTVVHATEAAANRALAAAFRELQLVDELMSLYRADSQVSRLNCEGRLEHPHPYLAGLLEKSLELSRRTGGAFDVTVQPLWSEHARAARRGAIPDSDALARALARVDWRQIAVTPTSISLQGEGQVTLNGIAQGFAADCALAALRQHGVQHALVDAGEVSTLGGKDAQSPWTVGIQHPRRTDAFLSLAKLDGRCLSTSGDYATAFDAEFRDHHIFDPHTGRSPLEFSSVSVAAPTATEADGLSTAVFVLGLDRGMQLIRETPGADGLLVLKDGTLLRTERFPIEIPT